MLWMRGGLELARTTIQRAGAVSLGPVEEALRRPVLVA